MCVRVYPATDSSLRVHLSVCNSVYSEERLGGTEEVGRERERVREGREGS